MNSDNAIKLNFKYESVEEYLKKEYARTLVDRKSIGDHNKFLGDYLERVYGPYSNLINAGAIDIEISHRVKDFETVNMVTSTTLEVIVRCKNLYTYLLCSGIVMPYYDWTGYEEQQCFWYGDKVYFFDQYAGYVNASRYNMPITHWTHEFYIERE